MSKVLFWKLKPSENRHFELQPLELRSAAATLNSVSTQIPGGVYTTFRTYKGDKVLPLEFQIKRLEESAKLLRMPVQLDRCAVQESLKQALSSLEAGDDLRIRLTLDLEQEPGTVYLALEPLHTPSREEYKNGVAAVTCHFQREIPRSKRTSFIHVAETFHLRLPPGVNEGLLLDENERILEGLSSNFFAVKEGIIFTAGEGVLEGITRDLALQAASKEKIPVKFQSISISEIPELEEAFLTGSSRSVLPVRQIDGCQVGVGKPGSVTESVSRAFWRELRARLVEV